MKPFKVTSWLMLAAALGASSCGTSNDSPASTPGSTPAQESPTTRDEVAAMLQGAGLAVCSVVDSDPGDVTDAIITLRATAQDCDVAATHEQAPPEVQVGLVNQPDKQLREAEALASTFRECQLVATTGDWILKAGNACVGSSMTTSHDFLEQTIAALRADRRVRVWPKSRE